MAVFLPAFFAERFFFLFFSAFPAGMSDLDSLGDRFVRENAAESRCRRTVGRGNARGYYPHFSARVKGQNAGKVQ